LSTAAGALIVNPRSGDGSSADELIAEARRLGIDVHILSPGDDPGDLAQKADAEILGMAGGDGSLAPVAAVCLERGIPFVCVPLGTRNHFARDLGLDPSDPVGVLAAFTGGVERRVDVGRANGRLFLNNVSLGTYARLVHQREHHRRRSDALARLRAFGSILRHPRANDFTVDGEPVHATVVLVANNAYSLEPLSLGQRERLDEGRLHVYVPSGLFQGSWQDRGTEKLVVDARGARLRAAADGEPEVLETPVEFTIEPGALRVLLPPNAAPRVTPR
jgi:diacylglycerol kinase family enzyme